MTTQSLPMPERRIARSVLAVAAGFLAVAIISGATDQLFHSLGVFPPWGEPMPDTGDNALALAYRTIYSVLGGYIAARLAPRSPLRHAFVLGAIGLAASAIGAFVAITRFDLGPSWYPLALVVIALPATLAGGLLAARRAEPGSAA